MKKFGLQLYSIKEWFENENDTRDAFLRIAEMGYTEAQTAGTYDYIATELFAKYAHDAGISICGTHYDFARIKGDIEGTVKYHRALDTKIIGIGGAGQYFDSKENTLRFVDEFNELADVYSKYGFTLSYHNHSIEGVKFDGKTVLDYLGEGFDREKISFCLDTCWLQFAGLDVCETIERFAGRVKILHLKDMAAWREYKLANGESLYAPGPVEVGYGNLNFKKIVETAERCGVEHFIVEDEYYSTGSPIESVAISASYLKNNLIEK